MSSVEPWVLGIDFGTSDTVAAQRIGQRPPEVIELGGERRMPSVVVIDESGTTIVGRAADNLAAANPTRAVRAPKSRLGDPSPIVLAGRAHRAVDLVAAQLRAVRAEAIATVGREPVEVRLTHPAMWAGARLAELIDAGVRAGIDQPVLVPEPVAAAAAYAENVEVAEGSCVAVYDLGGGTFDSAVLQATRGGFVIIGRPGGEDRLGGNLFDELLANHLGSQLEPSAWEALQVSDELAWQRAAATLRGEARKAKEALSTHPVADVLIALPTGLVHLRVDREVLDGLTRPHLQDSVEALDRTIGDAGIVASDLSAIFLTGGASRMPLVERLVTQAFPTVAVTRRGDPKTAVALGATHQLAVGSGRPRSWDSPVAPPPPAPPATPVPAPPTWSPPVWAPPGPAQADVGSPTVVVPGLAAAGGAAPPGPASPFSLQPVGAPPRAPRRGAPAALLVLGALALVLVAGAGYALARAGDGAPATSTTTLRSSTTTAAETVSTAAPVTVTSAPASTTTVGVTVTVVVTVPVTASTAPTVPSTAAPPTAPPPSGPTCPTTASEQNRAPGRPTRAVADYLTADYAVRICWTGTEFLYHGSERADPSTSVLLGAQQSGSGWVATAGAYTYRVTSTALVVTQGGTEILNQAVVSAVSY